MFDIHNNFAQSHTFSDTYEAYFHPKDKITKEWRKELPQSYIGEVLHRNIHRHGFYFIGNERKLFYDGLFYANKLEGYSQIIYHDGSNFQGLFKDNIRFGPGVLTYPNGEQDVGLWAGHQLLRLGGVNEKNLMPRLAPTPLGQLKLLKFRYLVPMCPIREDIAYTILENLGANERVLKKSHQLYNLEVENKHNVFFDKKLFDKHFYTEQDCYVDVILSDEEDTTDEDEVKEEQKEESPTPYLNLNMERVRQISEELEIIESKLNGVKKQKAIVQKKVEYCRSCCLLAENAEEELAPDQEEKVDVEEIQLITSPVLLETAPPTVLAATEGPSPRALVRTSTASTKDNEPPKGSLTRVPAPEKGAPIEVASSAENTSLTASMSLKDALSGIYSMTDDAAFPPHADASQKASSNEDSLTEPHFNYDAFPQLKSADGTGRIQGYLIDTCQCDEATHGRDLYELERELEAITMDEVFFESIRRNLKEKLETHLNRSQEGVGMRTKKLFVNDVLAWNNEEYCMRMLKQSFAHRKSEYMVNFKVCDLLAGSRHLFNDPGPHERNCVKFLTACSEGDTHTIFEQVGKNEINVNVCDAKGNNGIFFAAVNGHTETIKILMNLGGKLNQQNDEGLFPLSMCFLVFIAEKYQVKDWEKSFLPDVQPSTEQKEALKWYPNVSLVSLLERCEKSKEPVRAEKEHYIFNIDLDILTAEEINKNKEHGVLAKKSRSRVYIPQYQMIEESIKTLLKCGADPNLCEAPLPPLILSIFTEQPDLVESILGACTNVNTTIEHDMTGLHVIASLKPSQANVDITSLLLAYNLDPKLKTTTTHWPQQKAYILGKDVNPDEVEDHGKNPLHILCMRRDFPLDNCAYFQQMVTIFNNSDIDFADKYLGHTPLSLAVLMGNQTLVETMMQLPSTNPHQILDYDMGNALTIYILKKYDDIVPSNAKEILNCLVGLGANVLKPIGIWENAIEFMEKDDIFKRKKSKVLKEQPKKTNNTKVFSQKQLKNYIIELGRDAIIKYIQMQAVENLYNLIEDDLAEHECVAMLAEFLTLYVVIPNLQHLFRYGKIKAERYDKEVCLKLIDIVKAHQKEIKPKKGKGKNPKTANKKQTDDKSQQEAKNEILDAYDCSVILDITDFKKVKRVDINFNLLPPGIDNTSKYKICFHCLKRKNKVLLLCPRCQLVYFCSEYCNKANLKLHSPHTCNINFYLSVSKSLETPDAADIKPKLSELYNRVRENCEKRWLKKREEEIELERRKFEEEMKSDTYGIKCMRMMNRQRRSIKTPTVITLLGSTSDLTMVSDEYTDTGRKQVDYSVSNKTYACSDKIDPTARKYVNDSVTDEKYKCMVTKRHVISLTQLHNKSERNVPCKKKNCNCKACAKHDEGANNVKYKCIAVNGPKNMDKKLQVNREYDIFAEAKANVKKLRHIPSRYKEFIELLTQYFPEVDFSSLFLPYACYSNGHLYYKFLDKDVYTKTYSMM